MSHSDNPTVSRLHAYVRQPAKRGLAEMLLQRDGELCQLCREKKTLEIDHRDGNPLNWNPQNLRLLCHPCNLAERNRQRSMSSERENASASVSTDPTEVLHNSIDYQSGSPEMQANDIGIPKWLDFMCQEVNKNQGITRHSALNAGAAASGLTYQPLLRAYNKHVYQPEKAGDCVGPYMAFEERKSTNTGKRWVMLRPGWKIDKVPNRALLRPVPKTEEPSVDVPQAFTVSEGPV
ncbi:MAG: HNH endonuclease [Thaumarchaeota archaeon]|nr:HNH endonuclease [Nitrososphaerota archaeon]